jgi:ATP-binding cassette subfamily F protein uup
MSESTPYLDVQNLTKSFGVRVLFRNLTFSISEGQHAALIAKNGSGKSTLLSILNGIEGSDEGSIVYKRDLKIGYLEQTPKFNPEESVLDACFNHQGIEERILKAKQILSQLKISDLNQRIGELSGGEQKRVALANVLITDPDFLLLDEPTNHLDLEMIEWLEDFLLHSGKTFLMVTHDRYFLNNVCNIIYELDNQTIYTYRGNYNYYLEKRQQRIDATRAEIQHANNLYQRELDWMKRMPQTRGHKSRYREEAFYELQEKAKQRMEERELNLKTKNLYIGSKIFECQYISKAFDNKVILKDFYYNFSRYEKMGIIGNNGSGKSTFIKMLLGLKKPDSGHFDIGSTVRFGYFSQEGLKFDEKQKVIDVISNIAENINIGDGKTVSAAQFLQYFLFTPEQQYDYVYKLSGGERRKLYLCSVLIKNPNFLVLDEITNDLDIQTLQVLEEYLQSFPGCVIIISHDRFFMDKVVDHLLVFKGNGVIKDFPGNYTQYREWMTLKSKEDDDKDKVANIADSKKRDYHHDTRRRMTYKEKREFGQLSIDIDELEKEQKTNEEALCNGNLSVEKITKLSKRLTEIKNDLDKKGERWLELSEIEDNNV